MKEKMQRFATGANAFQMISFFKFALVAALVLLSTVVRISLPCEEPE